MRKTMIFESEGGQAVQIPEDMRLDGSEVYIERTEAGLLLIPKQSSVEEMWADWARALQQYDEPLDIERGGSPQSRAI